jgi:cysteinyl-tRNA synthetase
MHNGFLQVGQEKMSKSLGNMLSIKDVLGKHSPDAIRVFILSSHYRSPLSLSEEGLEGAEKGAERLARAANRADNSSTSSSMDAGSYRQQFIEAMDDDFNTAKAMGILFDLARDMNQEADSGRSTAEAVKILKELAGDVMGLRLPSTENKAESVEAAPFIELLIKTRYDLRQAKQYQLADEIRKKLADLGIILEDTPKGTSWRSKKP